MALVVITGGSRSGKSGAAQLLAHSASDRFDEVVVAVFGREADDEEMARRADSHRRQRPAGFRTIEVASASGWLEAVPPSSLLLLDCLGTALGLVMEECWPADAGHRLVDAGADRLPDGYADRVNRAFAEIADGLLARAGDTIVVTNEVGSGLVSAWASGRLFADTLGHANRVLVEASDSAYLAVCGRLFDLKSLPTAID